LLRNRTQILRKTRQSRANAQAAARVTAAAFRYPSFQLSKNRSRKPEVRWGHSFYVLSVTYRNRKFKMVLSKCCQKFHSRHSQRSALAKGGPKPGQSLAKARL